MGKPTLLVKGNLEGDPKSVPIDYIINWIKTHMHEFGGRKKLIGLEDRVLIIRSETGSGKSTVLPAYILRILISEKSNRKLLLRGPGVICTQPRVLTAQTLARDQAADDKNYPELVMGTTIGYQTGPVNEKPANGLIYATAGILLSQLKVMSDSEIIERYRFIIIDEAHERSLDIDSLLMKLKAFVKRNINNPKVPFVILASATISVKKYAEYFEIGNENIIEITGRGFGVETIYPDIGVNNYAQKAAETAIDIHCNNINDDPNESDILIFMPGQSEISAVSEILLKKGIKFKHTKSKIPPFLLLNISREEIIKYSRDYRLIKIPNKDLRIPSADGGKLLRPIRRIIVSTVVAETGLTIETLKYVIDCGWSRIQEIYYPGEFSGIITRPAPKSRIKQRKGRVGRKFPGKFYPLYTKKTYELLFSNQLPEIITRGVAPIFLDVIDTSINNSSDKIFKVEDIDMLDPPPIDTLSNSLERSITFGYIKSNAEQNGHIFTKLGKIASRFNYLDMNQIQTIAAGYLWKVSIRDLIFIICLYDEFDTLIYYKPPPGPGQKEAFEESRRKAIRTGLPDFIINPPSKIRGGDEMTESDRVRFDHPPTKEEEYYYRARLLISDDFIEALLSFDGFVKALDKTNGDLELLIKWCKNNGIDFEGAIMLTKKREKVINEMLAAGLNPFWGDEYRLSDSSAESFYDTLIRMKNCIYMGLRFSTLTYNKKTESYHASTGDIVNVPPIYAETEQSRLRGLHAENIAKLKPKRLVTNKIIIQKEKRGPKDKFPPLLYRLTSGFISILDGYVNIDETILEPRT